MQLHATDSVEAPHAEGAISGTGDPEGSESEDDDEILVPQKKKRANVKRVIASYDVVTLLNGASAHRFVFRLTTLSGPAL